MKITIGSYTAEYKVVRTTAPRAADYGYVIPLQESGGDRYVLMPEDRLEYQTGRYNSFLGGTAEVMDEEDIWGDSLLRILMDRLTQKASS